MNAAPTIKQLRHLVALAEHLHFGRAAEACRVTQSTLSASLKELEDILQATLVERTKRRVVLTKLGEDTLERARRILAEVDELADAARANRAPLSGPLRLGVIPTIGPFLLPRALQKLRRQHPRLKLSLVEDVTERLLADLNAGKLDTVLMALPYDIGRAERATLFADRFLLALRRDNPLADYERLGPGEFRGQNILLLHEGHCLRDQAVDACRLTRASFVDPFAATSLHTIVPMVDGGLGVTLLPEMAVKAGILRGTEVVVRPIEGARAQREIALVWRRGAARRAEYLLLAQRLKEARA